MNNEVTEAEARLALGSIEQRRQQVIAEIDVPPWYWVSVAGGWVVLGVLADYGPPWALIAGSVVFGAVHSARRAAHSFWPACFAAFERPQ